MNFLAPLFLLGLLAVGVPILLHLSRRRQTSVVEFPSLMFLNRVPYRSVRRRQVRDLLLMLLRCSAYAFLALAFARPFFVASAADKGEARLHRVVAIDQSYSMNRDDVWPSVKQAAIASFDALPADALGTLVTFDENGRVVLSSSGGSDDLRRTVESLKPADASTSFAAAMKTVRQVFLDAPTPKRELVLISDFQRVGRTLGDDLSLPAGTAVSVVALPQPSDSELGNVSVSEVELDRSGGGAVDRTRVVVSARVLRSGGSVELPVEVSLQLGGRDVDRQTLSLAPDSAQTVNFAPARQEPGVVSRGIVQLSVADELPIDNEFRFVLSPAQGIPVLIVRESRGSARFLQEAFALGRSPFFKPRQVRATELDRADLADRPVLILDDSVQALSQAGIDAIREHLDNDGGVMVVYGQRSERAGPMASSLGIPIPEKVRRSRSGEQGLSYLDLDHPALKIFTAPRSGDFSSVRIFAYQELSPLDSNATVLARFSNGAPALLEIARQSGRLLLWPSTLDTTWGDLPVQPVFLPMLHRLTSYLADYRSGREWYTVGQVVDLASQLEQEGVEASGSSWLVLTPDGSEKRIDSADDMLLPVDHQGFWRMRPIGSDVGQEQLTLAVNLDPKEADLTPLDSEIFEAGLDLEASEEAAPTQGGVTEVAPAEDQQKGWWYLLAVLLGILGVETWLAARRSRGRGSQSTYARQSAV